MPDQTPIRIEGEFHYADRVGATDDERGHREQWQITREGMPEGTILFMASEPNWHTVRDLVDRFDAAFAAGQKAVDDAAAKLTAADGSLVLQQYAKPFPRWRVVTVGKRYEGTGETISEALAATTQSEGVS